MHLFLTSVLPFLAHDHPAAVAFLTCRHHNFHASIIPEFLSDEERVQSFCEARQQNELEAEKETQYTKLYNLFVQTPLMQFSPSMVVSQKDFAQSILKPLLEMKYFTRTLQRCSVVSRVPLTKELFHGLSKVKSLTKLDLGESQVKNQHLEIIINFFPSLEALTIRNARHLETVDPKTAISMSSPPPSAIKTLRSLELRWAEPSFATQFVSIFPNLRKLDLFCQRSSHQPFDLLPLSSSLPLLTDMSLGRIHLKNTESLKNLVHLQSLAFRFCRMPDSLSFLSQQNSLPELATLILVRCEGLSTSTSFASLYHASNLHVLEVRSDEFRNEGLQHLENMVHLRKLDLSRSKITGDSRSLKSLTQNLFQLEELDLSGCRIGNQGAIAGALYSTHSRLRVLNLCNCNLVDDDVVGIGALKNTLEILDLSDNQDLTNDALIHCKDLVKLNILRLFGSYSIDDFSPVKDCLNLEELNLLYCGGLNDDSFKVFSDEPNSFPNLRVLHLKSCRKLTEKVFEHISKNNHLIYQLKELSVDRRLLSSATARNNICQLTSLRLLVGVFSDDADDADDAPDEEIEFVTELMRRLKNLEEIRQ